MILSIEMKEGSSNIQRKSPAVSVHQSEGKLISLQSTSLPPCPKDLFNVDLDRCYYAVERTSSNSCKPTRDIASMSKQELGCRFPFGLQRHFSPSFAKMFPGGCGQGVTCRSPLDTA